jgi:hypothetical protein
MIMPDTNDVLQKLIDQRDELLENYQDYESVQEWLEDVNSLDIRISLLSNSPLEDND